MVIMPSPKDLTGSLAQWDKRRVEAASDTLSGMYIDAKGHQIPERKLNLDIFSGWVYTMLFLTLMAQLAIVMSLDII